MVNSSKIFMVIVSAFQREETITVLLDTLRGCCLLSNASADCLWSMLGNAINIKWVRLPPETIIIPTPKFHTTSLKVSQ